MTHNGEFCQKKWLRLAPNDQFWSFCMFSHLFPQNEAQINLEWPISPNSQLFPYFATKTSHFWRNLKSFIPHGGGGAHQQILSFSTFSNYFTLKQLKMTHSGEFCQKKWLRLAPNGQFWLFCRFFHLFPQMRLRMANFN